LTTATTAVAAALTSRSPFVKTCLLAGRSEFRHELHTIFQDIGRACGVRAAVSGGVLPGAALRRV